MSGYLSRPRCIHVPSAVLAHLSACAVLCLFVALPVLAPARVMPFSSARDQLTTASRPLNQLDVADFNRDGWPDLLTRDIKVQSLSGDSGRVAVALHQGSLPPTFKQYTIFEDLDQNMWAAAAADLDGDGDLDVLFESNTPTPHALMWAENADGSATAWTTRGPINIYGDSINSIRTGDFDQDGDLDVIVDPSSLPSFGWGWEENTAGDGGAWEFRVVDDNPPSHFITLDVGDIDLNGALDFLVYTPSNNSHRIYWNNGANPPVFTKESLPIPHSYGELMMADVWGDRRLEFFRRDSSQKLWWYYYTGAEWRYDLVDLDVDVFSGLIDLDLDGSLNPIGVFDNDHPGWYDFADPNANYTDPWTRHNANTTTQNSYAAPADIDRDGDLDWVHAYNVVGKMGAYWFENLDPRKWGIFLPPIDINTAANGVRDIAIMHLNEDRWLDVAGAFFDGDNAQFNLGMGPKFWAFEPGQIIGSGTPLNGAAAIAAGRVDRDGLADIVTAAADSGQIRCWQNLGVENPAAFIGHLVWEMDGAKDVALADFDRDGDLDIAAVGRTCTTDIIPICRGNLVWFEQSGPLGLKDAWTSHTIQATRTDYTLVEAGDVDGDGDIDLVVGYRNTSNPPVQITTNAIQWFENVGGAPPQFTPHTITSTISGSSVQALRVVDMDGDADLDVLAADFTGDGVRWHENTAGDGSAWTAQPIAAGFDAVRAVDAADVDQDGDVDVLVASHDDNMVYVLENDGGAWPALFQYMDLLGPRAARFADVNNDGAVDIVAGFDASDKIVWFPGSVGSFTLSSYDIAPASVDEGAEFPVLRAEMSNWERPGGNSIIPHRMSLILRDQNSTLLSGLVIKKILSHVALYADADGDCELGPNDPLVVDISAALLPDAILSVPLDLSTQTGSQLAIVPPGDFRCFFGVVGVLPGAAASPITHISVQMIDVDDEEAREYPTNDTELRERAGVRETTKKIAIQDVIFSLDGWLLR